MIFIVKCKKKWQIREAEKPANLGTHFVISEVRRRTKGVFNQEKIFPWVSLQPKQSKDGALGKRKKCFSCCRLSPEACPLPAEMDFHFTSNLRKDFRKRFN